MKEIRLGTIGSGMIVHAILKNVIKTQGIRLEAVYSRSMETGKKLAEAYGAHKAYTDMDAFLADPDVNVVYIASPNLLHYPQAKQALLAGKHVILEKPFSPKAEQARELVALAKTKGLLLVDAVPTACLPNLKIIRRELPKIGRIRLVMGNFSQYSSRYDRVLAGETPNVFNPEYAGGCLMDLNFYNVYLNIALFGKPEEAVYYPNIYPGLADTSGSLILRYHDFVSQNAGAKDTWGVNFFQIEGEKGFIYASDGPSLLKTVRVVTKESDETFNEQHNPDHWAYEVQEVTERILAGDYETIYHNLNTMLDVIETIETSRKRAGIFYPGDDVT